MRIECDMANQGLAFCWVIFYLSRVDGGRAVMNEKEGRKLFPSLSPFISVMRVIRWVERNDDVVKGKGAICKLCT